MSAFKAIKKEAKAAWKLLESALSYELIEDPYKGSPVPVRSPLTPVMLPFFWITSDAQAWAEPLPREDVPLVAKALREEMRRHEEEVLKEAVLLVCLFRSMTLQGESVGGTCDLAEWTIYLPCSVQEDGWKAQLARAFHHEAAHLLLQKHRLHWAEEAWKSINPPGFEYGTGGMDAIKTGKASGVWAEEWFEQGFLHEYASSSVDEDFCSIVEALFMDDPEIHQLLDSFPLLKAKAGLADSFFRHLHGGYSKRLRRSS